MSNGPLLTTEEVIARLAINLRTLYRLVRAGKLPAARVGRQWRFRQQDVDLWIMKNRGVLRANKATAAKAPARVLVVDDEAAVLGLLGKFLTDAGYSVDTAGDGPTAVELITANNYDLLITDLKMPGMHGLEVVRRARTKSLYMPIIIITGFSTEATAVEAANLGVSGYIRKPFRSENVMALAARCLGDEPPVTETSDVGGGGSFQPE